jgi:hypothetical protein
VPPSSHGPNAGRVFDPEVAPRPAPDRQSPAPSPARPVLVAAVCALLAGLAVEAAPLVGGDLIAQTWWASWASSVGRPVDLGWYGGVPVASYSLLGPWLAAAVGLPAAGIAGTVLGAASTTALLGRLRPSPGRWTAAGVLAALAWAADQWSGRTTFGAGAALGCLALVLAGGGGHRRVAHVGAAVLAALAGAVSPLASAFLLIAVAAWWLGAGGRTVPFRARPSAAWWVAGGALVPLIAAPLLGGVSGPEPTRAHQMVAALAAAALTGALLPPRCRAVRTGVALTCAVLLLTWLVGDPVGSNSTRLVLLFAVPILVAAARTPPLVTVLACLGVVWLLPPLIADDLGPRDLTASTARADALVGALSGLSPVGRIEVVPLHGHQESLEVGARVPLARGWLRQLDVARGSLFYADRIDAAEYLQWLRSAGVSYVALPGGRVDWPAHQEAALLRHGVPGLQEVWTDGWWRLYRVPGGALVRGATLVSSDRSALVVDAPRAGPVQIALWWSRWSSAEGPGGCVRPGERPGWTTLEVRRPGRYVVTSSWRPTGRCG